MKHLSCDAFEILACPTCGASLRVSGTRLRCADGHLFPVVQGVPVLLRHDVEDTLWVGRRSLTMANENADGRRVGPYFVETLGILDTERDHVRSGLASGEGDVDPVVSYLVGATNGILYRDLIGKLDRIPIPILRLPPGNGARLLDVGCNWGRWSLAAAAKGYRPVGVDPSLGAVLAAKRLAARLGLPFEGIVADARHLPLKLGAIDTCFSYSVLQHFSKSDARAAMRQIARATRPAGTVKIQMASATGARSLQHILRRRFREPKGFEIRYWLPRVLLREFRAIFGDGQMKVDCYFGLGLQPSDRTLYSTTGRVILTVSEALRKASTIVRPLAYVADSIYLTACNSSRPTAEAETR
jgi:SAM-dependent methyltransferase/uncharacterized protein YbaR (Trm112 family)